MFYVIVHVIDANIIGKSYLLIGQQQTTPRCFFLDSQNQIGFFEIFQLCHVRGSERDRIPNQFIQLFVLS